MKFGLYELVFSEASRMYLRLKNQQSNRITVAIGTRSNLTLGMTLLAPRGTICTFIFRAENKAPGQQRTNNKEKYKTLE